MTKTKLEKFAEKYELLACYEETADVIYITDNDIFNFDEPITDRIFRLLADINKDATNSETFYITYRIENVEYNENFFVICSCYDLYNHNI